VLLGKNWREAEAESEIDKKQQQTLRQEAKQPIQAIEKG